MSGNILKILVVIIVSVPVLIMTIIGINQIIQEDKYMAEDIKRIYGQETNCKEKEPKRGYALLQIAYSIGHMTTHVFVPYIIGYIFDIDPLPFSIPAWIGMWICALRHVFSYTAEDPVYL